MRKQIRMGIMVHFVLDVPKNMDEEATLRYLINGNVRQAIEENLPEGWAMKVVLTEVDGKRIENVYE